MPQSRPQWLESLQTIAPWIGATVALLLAVVLMARFIDTLHLSIARGEALRAEQAAPTTSAAHAAPDALRLADTGAHAQR